VPPLLGFNPSSAWYKLTRVVQEDRGLKVEPVAVEFFHPINAKYFEHWMSLEKNGLLPNASSFYPEEVPDLLPYFAVYELLSEDHIYIRLAGTAMVDRFGFEITGKNYLDLVAPERRANASAAFWTLANQPCGMRVIIQHVLTNGLRTQIEALGMPMRNDRGGKPLLYYTGIPVEDAWRLNRDDTDKMQELTVLQRDFIDIGAGKPDFRD
jgi:hypothetical protein